MSGMVNVSAAFPSATEAGGNIFQLLKLIDNQDEYKKRIEELSAAEQAAKEAADSLRSKRDEAHATIEEANRTATAVAAAQEALAKARKDFTDTQTAVALELQLKQDKLDADAAELAQQKQDFSDRRESWMADTAARERSLVAKEANTAERIKALQQREAAVDRQMTRIREIAAD